MSSSQQNSAPSHGLAPTVDNRASAAAPASSLRVQQGTPEQLRQFAAAGYLFAVLDATGHPNVPEKARQLADRSISLFQGTAEENHWDVAPYLFRVDEATLAWIEQTLWNEPWGVFVMSRGSLEDLRGHLRRFLLVELPDGERWFFRYYDPRILKVYLPACDETELQLIFGAGETGIRAFGIADPDTKHLLFIHRPEAGVSVAQQASSPDALQDLLWKIRPEQIVALQAACAQESEQTSQAPAR